VLKEVEQRSHLLQPPFRVAIDDRLFVGQLHSPGA
jgi:hypothetical protein